MPPAVANHQAVSFSVRRHLKPGGLLVVQGSLGESVYTVGSAIFPVLNVDEDDVREVFCDKARAKVKIPSNESLWL